MKKENNLQTAETQALNIPDVICRFSYEELQYMLVMLTEGHTIGLSSRRMGTVDENGYVNYEKITEYGVINYLDEILNKSKQ